MPETPLPCLENCRECWPARPIPCVAVSIAPDGISQRDSGRQIEGQRDRGKLALVGHAQGRGGLRELRKGAQRHLAAPERANVNIL